MCSSDLEAAGGVGLEVRLIALWVERWLAAIGRCQGQLRACVDKGVVGRGQLFEPETGLFTSVAKLLVGSQNEEDLHVIYLADKSSYGCLVMRR